MTRNKRTFGREIGAAAAIALLALALVGCPTDAPPERAGPRRATVRVGDGVYMSMAWVAPGSFTMGQAAVAPNAGQTERRVTLTRGFYMGIHPVTQEQFYAVMGANPSRFQGVEYPPADGEAQERRPVEMVNWYHAIAFANRLSILQGLEPVYHVADVNWETLTFENVPTSRDEAWDAVTANWDASGFRLPTEAEWECVDKARKTAIMTTKCPASTLGMIS